MSTANKGLTRRQALATAGAGVLAAGFGVRPALALETVRQGYQTNMWGMPTYYLLRSGLLEKHGVKFEEFAVPSGNLTMQQMVARQVDMGTYAGPSFAIGHDKGGLLAIAMIEYVGKTARVMARKDLGITKVEQLRGQEGRQPDRILDRQHFRRPDRDQGRPEEGRLPGNPHERERHGGGHGGQNRRCDGAMSSPTTRSQRLTASPVTISEFDNFDKLPVFMAATPEFVAEKPGHRGRLSQGVARSRQGLQEQPEQGRRIDLFVLHVEGLQLSKDTFAKALARVEVQPGWPSDLKPYMTQTGAKFW